MWCRFFNPKNYPDAVQGTFIDPQKLTASERKYGIAPKRDPRVTYQDGVILMERGDEAIREAKTDGMTFSFDAKAEHVGELAEGKIVFATGRVVVGQSVIDAFVAQRAFRRESALSYVLLLDGT
jgi:hypothetical protein